ncbi:MAG: hypothetical protein K2X11_02980 [Acetobacteraceae bacterium]|nr:hypothetical protein [Acetobacteraceae bacterium]
MILAAAVGLLAAAPAFAQSAIYCNGRLGSWASPFGAGTDSSGQPGTRHVLFLRNLTQEPVRFTGTVNHARSADRPRGFSAGVPVRGTASLTMGVQTGGDAIPQAELLGTTVVTCG